MWCTSSSVSFSASLGMVAWPLSYSVLQRASNAQRKNNIDMETPYNGPTWVNSLEIRVIPEKGFFLFCGFRQRHLVSDLLLTSAPDNHVPLFQVDDLIVDDVNHVLLCPLVHKIRLGQDSLGGKNNTKYKMQTWALILQLLFCFFSGKD